MDGANKCISNLRTSPPVRKVMNPSRKRRFFLIIHQKQNDYPTKTLSRNSNYDRYSSMSTLEVALFRLIYCDEQTWTITSDMSTNSLNYQIHLFGGLPLGDKMKDFHVTTFLCQ